MANRKISELQSRTPALSDLMLVGDPSSGYSYKCTVTALATIIETDIADGFVTIGTTQTVSGAKTFSNNLTLTSVANTPTDPDKFLTLNASNVVTYRTGSQVLSDIGGQGSITLTTTGTSGAATLVGSTLNIPNYGSALSGYVPYTGATTNVNLGTRTITANGIYSIEGTYVANTFGLYGRNAANNAYNLLVGITAQDKVYIDANASGTIVGGTLTLSVINNATIDTDTFLVADSGVVKYRTGAQLLSDIGGASSSSISGTTNYIPKFTSSSAIGNSAIYDNSGNIGINNTSAAEKLDVIGNIRVSSGNNLYVYNAANTRFGSLTTNVNGTELSSHNGAGEPLILTSPVGYINFNTNGSERLRISSTGNVSIGNTNNTYKLDVSNVGGSVATQRLYGNDQANVRLRLENTGGRTWELVGGLPGANNSNFSIYDVTGTATRLTIDASGNLGINTSSPAAKLDVQGSSSDQIRLRTAATEYYGIGRNSSTGYLDFYGSQSGYVGYLFGGVNGTRMTLDASGNLGLGVSPSAWDAANTKALQLDGGSFYMYGGDRVFLGQNIFFAISGDTYVKSAPATTYRQYNGQHAWYNAPSGTAGNAISFTQAMTLASTGNLLVGGTSDAGYKLDVNGTTRFSGTSIVTSAGGYGAGLVIQNTNATANNFSVLTIQANTDGYSIIEFKEGATQKWQVFNDFSDDSLNFYKMGTGAFNLLSLATTGAATFSSSVTATSFNGTTNNIFSVSGTEGMRLTSTGLGIGTTSPAGLLQLQSTTPTLYITGVSDNTAIREQAIYFGASNTATAGYIKYQSYSADNYMAIATNSSERMRITSGGELLVGATDNPQSARAHFKTSGGGTSISTISTQDSYIAARFLEADGDLAGYISVSTGAVAYNTSSDYRLKQDLKTFNGLSLIDSIKVYDYQWKANNQRSYGVLAHELQSVIPYAVTGEKDGQLIQGVDYSKLVPVLVQAIKELKAELQILKNK